MDVSKSQIETLNAQVDERDEKLSHWTRNPFFTITTGVVLGMLVTGYALNRK